MRTDRLSSRERMLLAMEYRETDHTPCSFMMFHGLRDRYPGNQFRFLEEQMTLGLDAVAEFPELPMPFHPDVTSRSWVEHSIPGEAYPVVHKEYDTPAGKLLTSVRQTEDYPSGDGVEFYSDFNVPRSRRFHVNEKKDLKAFRYLLMPPTAQQVRDYREQCGPIREFAARHGLMTRGVRGVLIDAAIRFAGVEGLSSMAAVHFDAGDPAAADPVDRASCRPDAAIVSYGLFTLVAFPVTGAFIKFSDADVPPEPPKGGGGLISSYSDNKRADNFFFSPEKHITPDTPPFFMWQTCDNDDPRLMFNFAKELADSGVRFEAHIFPFGPHGLGLADGVNNAPRNDHVKRWLAMAMEWLEINGF